MATLSRFALRTLAPMLALAVGAAGLLTAPRCAQAQSTDQSPNTSDTRSTSGRNSDTQNPDKTGTDNTHPDRDMPDKNAPGKSGRPRPSTPPPGNPIVKINPEDGSGNDTKEYTKDGTRKLPRKWGPPNYGDFKPNADDPRNAAKAKNLPIFGYNYFAAARRRINAESANLYQQYPYLRSSNGQSQRNRNQRSTTTGNRRSTSQTGANGRDNAQTDDNATDRNGRRASGTDRANSDNLDNTDNTDNSNLDNTRPDRNTRAADGDMNADDDNTDNPPVRRRRGANNQDDMGDDADNGDNQSQVGPLRRSRATTQDDANSDDDQYISADDQEQQDNLIAQNRRRELLGLPPVGEDYSDSDSDTSRRTNSRDNLLDDAYPASRSLSNRSLSARNSSGYGYPYDTGGSSYDRYGNLLDESYPRNNGREPVDAFSQIGDPLTQLTRNIVATAPTNYQLSGGDSVQVRYSNPAMQPREITRTVDAQGALTLDEVGHINVAGMTLAQAQTEIERRLARLYKHVTVDVRLRSLRTITVTVSGKAYLAGDYYVPASTTALQILNFCGGPTRDGSLRNIQIRRQNQVIPFDFYRVMAMSNMPAASAGKGQQYQQDVPLQSGDVIYIPTYHARVALQGEISEPALYELREGETLQDAINFAGDVKATAVTRHVQVSTIDPGNGRVIKDVDLKSAAGPSLALYDGDVVNVMSLRPVVENKVTVVGAVAEPSDYALTPNMHVADLVRAAGNTISETYLGHAALYRWNSNGTTTLIPIDLAKALDGDPENNQALLKWDRLEVYSRQEAFFTGNHKVIVRGAVQRGGIYQYADNMRVGDLLYKVGGPLPDAEMVVVEHQHGDGTKKYDFVSVADIIGGNHAKDIALEDNDIVGVYRNGETGFIPEHKVMVRGAVQTPGLYDRGEGMKLSDLIKLAGDFKPDAGERVVIAHARRPIDGPDSNIRTVAVLFDSQHRCAPQDDLHLEDGDEVLIQGKGGFEDKPRIVFIGGKVNRPGPYPITSKNMRLSDLITQAGGLRPEAFPEGAEFYREPKMLGTQQQRELANIVSDLNDLNNVSAYKRELAKSDLERIRASGTASQSSSPLNPGSASPNPVAAALATELSKHDLVSKPRSLAGNLEPTGNMAVNLPNAIRKPGGIDDILLVDGDRINIPETPTTIEVAGGVVNPRGVLYQPGQPLSYYVAQTGGYAPDAAPDRIVVIHAGGGMAPGKQVRALRPGDVIIVPTRVMSEKLSSGGSNVGNFFNQVLGGALIFRLLGL
jgi:protein involved in polysaccharide export with SLBB domain